MYAYTVEQVRRIEQRAMAGVAEGALMQRAAAGLSAAILRQLRTRIDRAYGARVLIMVGPGNNGGDALWAGARLARRGFRSPAGRRTYAPAPFARPGDNRGALRRC